MSVPLTLKDVGRSGFVPNAIPWYIFWIALHTINEIPGILNDDSLKSILQNSGYKDMFL